MPTRTIRRWALLGLLPLCGCLTSEPAPVPPPDLRIIVTTTTEYPTATEAALRAGNVARVPVRDADDLGAGRYRMVLVCPDTATCRAAAQRIANDRTFALGVDAEFPGARQRTPLKPTREQSR